MRASLPVRWSISSTSSQTLDELYEDVAEETFDTKNSIDHLTNTTNKTNITSKISAPANTNAKVDAPAHAVSAPGSLADLRRQQTLDNTYRTQQRPTSSQQDDIYDDTAVPQTQTTGKEI